MLMLENPRQPQIIVGGDEHIDMAKKGALKSEVVRGKSGGLISSSE